MHKKILIMLLAAILLLGAFGQSRAALQAVGPTSPATGYFPVWYSDGTRQLELCLSTTPSPDPGAAGDPMCVLLPAPGYDLALPVSFPLNFPDESFWFTADASIVDAVAGVDVRFVSSLEAAFGTGFVANGDQISFARIRFYVQVPTPGTYTFTHPFGVDTFVVDTIDPVMREIQYTRDIGVATAIFTGALAGDIGPFLVRSLTPGGAPAPIVIGAETFLGDPNVLQKVTGSPFGTNFLRIVGPGIDITTTDFAISGKVFGGTLPPDLTFDRSTYSRTAAGGTQVEVFATAPTAAAVSFRETLAPGPETTMTNDPATGRFYTRYAPAVAIPANLVATATQVGAPPTILSSPVVDLVKITKAAYNFDTKELTIEAASSDQLVVPTLTALGWGALAPLAVGGGAQGVVVPNVAEPPARVTVLSSAGGSDTEPVAVSYINLPPVAVNDAVLTNQGVAAIINVLINDTDPNQNLPLTVSAASLTQPTNGTVVVNIDQTVTYTPNAGFFGTDSFTYQAADALGALSNVATVTVTVNALPVANPDTAITHQGVAVVISVLANDTDVDGTLNPATVTVATAALNGTTVVNATTGAVTYTPNAGFAGTDTFGYTVQDNLGAVSNVATVTVSINRPPVAVNDTAATATGTPVAINVLVNDTDADGTLNPATVAVTTAALNGTTAVNTTTGAVTYTPVAGFAGTDSFSYTVQDNLGALSNAATVTVSVNRPPAAVNDNAATAAGAPVVINVLANDTDADGALNPASVAITAAALNGTTAINTATGAVTYTPNAGFAGTDGFTYTVQDNLGAVSNAALVSVTVTAIPAVNVAPVAANDTAATPAGTAVVINILSNDTDSDGTLNPLSVTLSAATSGTTSVNTLTGAVTYVPTAAFTGTDGFTYTVRDNAGALSNTATVTVTVTALPAANTAPVAVDDAAGTAGVPVAITILANDTDADGTLNPASVAVTTAAASGTTTINTTTGAVTYTPNAGFTGTDSFVYTVQDNLGAVSNAATVTVTVTAVPNVAPTAVNDTATASAGTALPIAVLANDSDPDGVVNPASVAIGAAPLNGAAAVNAATGVVTYTPNAGYSGPDSFTYTVQDNLGAVSNAATVAITVNPAVGAPVANNDAVSRRGRLITISVTGNDRAARGSRINRESVLIVTPPAHGTVTPARGGVVRYVPTPGYIGVDTFTYTVKDNLGRISNAATVTVTVR